MTGRFLLSFGTSRWGGTFAYGNQIKKLDKAPPDGVGFSQAEVNKVDLGEAAGVTLLILVVGVFVLLAIAAVILRAACWALLRSVDAHHDGSRPGYVSLRPVSRGERPHLPSWTSLQKGF